MIPLEDNWAARKDNWAARKDNWASKKLKELRSCAI